MTTTGKLSSFLAQRRKQLRDTARISRTIRKDSNGECHYCPDKRIPGTTLCPACTQANRDGVKALRLKRISQGICIRCGKTRAQDNTTMCQPCRKKNNAWAKQSYLRNRRKSVLPSL